MKLHWRSPKMFKVKKLDHTKVWQNCEELSDTADDNINKDKTILENSSV